MPYRNAASLPLRAPTKERLEAEVKAEGQSWDELLQEVAENGIQGGDRE